MDTRRRIATILLAAALAGTGCVSTQRSSPVARTPLGLVPDPPVKLYRVAVTYTNQNDIGVPLDFVEIQAKVRIGMHGAEQYCRWESYEVRSYRVGDPPKAWEPYQPAVGFDYLMIPVRQETDYIPNLPNVDSIPRDLTGFYFYINLIDLHMWDLYRYLFLETREVFPSIPGGPLRAIGDTMQVDLTDLPIALLAWENVSSDLVMTGGVIGAEFLGTGLVHGVQTKILAFEQSQTIRQTIFGMGMRMPYDGTNRFLGHMHLDQDDGLVLASYREFVYAKVKAPMSQIVIVHSQRDYRIELLSQE